jgi:hypothetical protein
VAKLFISLSGRVERIMVTGFGQCSPVGQFFSFFWAVSLKATERAKLFWATFLSVTSLGGFCAIVFFGQFFKAKKGAQLFWATFLLVTSFGGLCAIVFFGQFSKAKKGAQLFWATFFTVNRMGEF